MAIKIKKNVGKSEEPIEDVDAVDVDELDQFLVAGTQSVGWATENQNLVLMAVIAVLVVSVGVVFFMEQAKQQRIEDAKGLVAAIDVMEAPVGDEKPVNITPPGGAKMKEASLKFDTYEAKYKDLGQKADTYLTQNADGDGVGIAKLLKAKSSFELGQFDEAITLYQGWLSSNNTSPARPFVMQALATSQASAGKVEEAVKTLDTLAGLDKETYGEYAAYQKGVYFETAGKKDQAKSAFEAVVKDFPEGQRTELAKMRLDLM